MSFRHTIITISDDDDADAAGDAVALLDYDSDASEPDIITIEDDVTIPDREPDHPSKDPCETQLPDVEEHEYQLRNGTLIIAGSTVELEDKENRPAHQLHSGDFLRVKHIVRNLETDEVRLRGFMLRRTKYHGQLFDWKTNELVVILNTAVNDRRPPLVQGMVDICAADVVCTRECILTDKPYPAFTFRAGFGTTPDHAKTQEQAKRHLFHHGVLVCRAMNILTIYENGSHYAGVVRQLYSHEADSPSTTPTPAHSARTIESEDDDLVIVTHKDATANGPRRTRSDSIEIIDHSPRKRRPAFPSTRIRYTFGDAFCGAGGASQGAKQAGLIVTWGLDNDERAIRAFSYNHRGALPFNANAHEFPPKGATDDVLQVDILHLSPPCKYWSPAHTRIGRNDQENYEAIFTVGPILTKCQPRIATIEQTYGLATHTEHRKEFMLLLNSISKAGYNLRYKIQDLSEFGLPQRRVRLLIIAAKRGTPLPPFPKPTHGDPGTGLQRYTSVADALQPLERFNARASDKYHQPGELRPLNKPPYNPHTTFLKACITTDGGQNYHPSGKRTFTPREFASLQTFPPAYRFSGPRRSALEQIGNAFPPVAAEALCRCIAKTLEAFDNGLIGAEEEFDDLDALLEKKGVVLPASASVDLTGSTRSPYRYLTRENSSSRVGAVEYGSPFGRKNDIEPPVPSRPQATGASGGLGGRAPFRTRRQRKVVAEAEQAEEFGEVIMLD